MSPGIDGSAPREPQDAAAPQGASMQAALIRLVGELTGETVLVVGGDGPELTSRLLGLGAARVIRLRPHDRPEPASAGVAVVPHLVSLDWAATALAQIRRALTTNGRIFLCAGARRSGHPVAAVERMLRVHGYSAIRAAHAGDHLLLRAEVPMFGPRCRD